MPAAGACTRLYDHNSDTRLQDGQDLIMHNRPQNVHPPLQFDPYWNFQLVVFRVERTLFSVLKKGFMLKGTTFETLFNSQAFEDWNTAPGSSANNPIILEETSTDDFRAFLEVLYPPTEYEIPASPDLISSRWVGVLRLANKWGFVEIRQKAINDLRHQIARAPGQEKIKMGKQFYVKDWLRDGLLEVVLRKNLTLEELQESLEPEIIMKIFYIQSAAWQKQEESTRSRCIFYFTPYAKGLVEEVFATILEKADYRPPETP